MGVLAVLLFGCSTGSADGAGEPSFLIEGANVIDGTGAPGRTVSVRVAGGQIAAVGTLSPEPDEEVVAAHGLVLTPGFIDTHSHHDRGLSESPQALGAVSQGITTVVVGQDGGSELPLARLFQRLETSPVAVNVASYVGHGTLRRYVMEDDFRREATADEVLEMEALLALEMEEGALGLSTGLEYDPGIYSSTEEVVALARVTGARGGRYITHLRSEDRDFFSALAEAISIAEAAELPVQISHMKLAMRGLWGRAGEALALLDEARGRGLDITADVYPYEYWQSTMTVLFPERDLTDRSAAQFALDELVPPEGMLIGRFEANPEIEGLTLAQISESRGTDAVTTFLSLLAEAYPPDGDDGNATGPRESIVGTSMTTEDIRQLLSWEHTNVASDGALAGAHPRGFGSHTRVLGRFVDTGNGLSLEEAVHKMTGLAAAHVGIEGRGVIEAGAVADLVLFDPETVGDRATPEEPHLPSSGIERVWVAGEVVYEPAGATGATPGVVIRRSGIESSDN
ncbi:MAG: N-acyl-D-amino-acid deacylase family protein [Longimicrobiales bacterium]